MLLLLKMPQVKNNRAGKEEEDQTGADTTDSGSSSEEGRCHRSAGVAVPSGYGGGSAGQWLAATVTPVGDQERQFVHVHVDSGLGQSQAPLCPSGKREVGVFRKMRVGLLLV